MVEEPPRAFHAHGQVTPATFRSVTTMTRHVTLPLAIALLLVPVLGQAQNREHLQMNADLRMLEEQVSRLQLAANQLSEQLQATNKRLDAQADSASKAFADLQARITQVVSTSNTLRENISDNSTRVAQMGQEVSSLRDGVRNLTDLMNKIVTLLTPAAPTVEVAPGAEGAPTPPLSPLTMPASPKYVYDQAMNDYMSNRLDNAIEGFQEVVTKFPTSPAAAEAQFYIGESFYTQNKCKEAVPAYGKLIATYKDSERVPEAHYMQGVCYLDLNQRANAQKSFELLVRQYPDSPQASQAAQKLRGMGVTRSPAAPAAGRN